MLEKDANVEPETTLEEDMAAAEKEVDAETSEESSTQETTQKDPEETPAEQDDETSTLEGLDKDEDFQVAKKELEAEMGGNELTFNQTKRFRKTYYEAKEGQRQRQELQDQLAELQDKHLSDNEILGEATKRGLLDREATPAKEEGSKLDLEELYLKATSEQREWLDIIKAQNEASLAPIQEQLKAYKEKFGEISQTRINEAIRNEEDGLRKSIKETYGLDYDKDVLPEMQKLIPGISKNIPKEMTLADAGWTPTLLANQVLVNKSAELAQKKLAKDNKKLNETKKTANVETDGVQGVTEPVDDTDKDLRQIFLEETEKLGMSKFE